ncbi:ANTAR domain-containing protein [Actinokineospora pegani]|uniref:ANTAR domain-containing protein n=1 Tax=Actinokineospora pegani TaxID=2654637 RepID=UPI0018D2E211|nr:GAF and ANTAR domain-containing protein [Actinokineospora pegani]
MAMQRVRVEAGVVRAAVVVRLAGTLDSATAAETRRELADATEGAPPPDQVVVDVRDVERLSEDGARTLVAFARAAEARGMWFGLLVAPDSPVPLALDAVDPRRRLPRFDDLSAALAVETTYDEASLDQQVRVLTRSLLQVTTVHDVLRQVVDAAALAIPGAATVSVNLRHPDGAFRTPLGTAGIAADLDQVQYRSGRGPCADSAKDDGPAFAASADLRDEPRWPEFAAAAVAAGYHSVLSTALLPAAGPGRLTGALNVYATRPHGLTTWDRHAALLLATHASLALAQVRQAELADLRDAQLRRAIDSRDVIGQAKGILMNRQGISADEAFTVLRRTSQDLNVKLVDLATTLARDGG